MQIAPGLIQLKVPIPNNSIGYVLPYLFEVPGGCAIIDPGWDAPESIESLRGQLAELGIGFGDLKQVIVTHVHPDHYGMAGKLREASGCTLVIHEKELELMQRRAASPGGSGGWLRQNGVPQPIIDALSGERGRRAAFFNDTLPDRTMTDGEFLHLGALTMRAIWTPGHAPGHVCFYEEDLQVLLSGDHVLPRISPNVSFRPGSEDDSLGDYLWSIKRLRGLRVQHVLPAHEYNFDDLERRLDELEEHHRERLQEVMDAIDAGAETAYAVAGSIRWKPGALDSLSAWSQQAALAETLAHLNHAVRLQDLRQVEVEGVIRYYRV